MPFFRRNETIQVVTPFEPVTFITKRDCTIPKPSKIRLLELQQQVQWEKQTCKYRRLFQFCSYILILDSQIVGVEAREAAAGQPF
jgi:hypothetical protein